MIAAKIFLALLTFAATALADDVCGLVSSTLYTSLTAAKDECSNENEKYAGFAWLCSFDRNTLTRTVVDWDAVAALFSSDFQPDLLATCQEGQASCENMDEGGLDSCIEMFTQCLIDGIRYPMVSIAVEIRDALDNSLISSAEVDAGLGAPGITDDNGRVELGTLCAGQSITVTASHTGFEDASATHEIGNDESQIITISMTQSLEAGELRMVLNWGPEPRDLDSNVIQLSSDYKATCRVSYRGNCPGVTLDLDNTKGGNAGAETITWSGLPDSNKYLLYVYDYSANPNVPLSASAATINIYGNVPTVSVEVPKTDPNSPASRYWIIGSLDGDIGLGSFNPINCLSNQDPYRAMETISISPDQLCDTI